jgi:tetratricopeptide (TPR) repeat protein/tRNA A-37 threonylcarbamoyl transferase component Bud32
LAFTGFRMAELTARLQAALGAIYRVERELGGGGMSRVFVAEEVALGRKVVVKVLPPEMSAGVNAERFRREIQLAASLQHPHIVPLLTAGSADDLLYYVMPHIPGESLREKLAREGELPVGDTLRILRDVLDALAEAHANGVVHRDIKPDNILLSGKHAVVTDFGVAKAVSESVKGSTITSLGVALGTPAYMAPEQAAADPHVDHRADVYAVGALAYEMLCGRPPFVAPTPQAVLAAQVTQAPEPCTAHRPTVSPALNALVMRCLEKKAADRPQSAGEVLVQVEAMATPSGGMVPTDATVISSGTRAAIERHHPLRVVGLSVVGALALLGLVYAAVRLIGLPAWVTGATVAILAVGFPVVLVTGRQERRRLIEKSTGAIHATPPGLRRHFTWKRASVMGGAAFAGLAVLTGAYMAMRLLGIGPLGTLLAKGTFKERDRIVIADFENRTSDSTLGRTIQELIRIDLDQSPVVSLLTPSQVREALGRMRQAAGAALTLAVAAELAQREGAKAVLTGEVVPLGRGYVVSVRLASAATGEVLAARRETASGGDELIGAVDRVSRGLRERIGESLRSVQGGQPLERVTTGSLEALRKYTEATGAGMSGQYMRSLDLLRQAIHLDTNFAMAYRRLGAYLRNVGAPRGQVAAAATRAFELRGRLPERERLLAEAAQYDWVLEDRDRAIETYRALLDRYPDDATAWNNLGNLLRDRRRWVEAESAFARAVGLGLSLSETNLSEVLALQGNVGQAEEVFRRWAGAHPQHPDIPFYRAGIAILRGDYDGAEAIVREAVPAWRAGDATTRWDAEFELQAFAGLRGHIREARRHASAVRAANRELGVERLPVPLADALDEAFFALWYGRPPGASLAALEVALARSRLDTIPPSLRSYDELAFNFARAGNAARAREFMERYDREATDLGPRTRAQELRFLRGQIALAEQRWPDAISELRTWQDSAETLSLIWVADAYDQGGQADSAIALYERWLATPGFRVFWDGYWLPQTLRRLGELHEARGDRARAREYYVRFADLWKNADLEFQPMVREARAKAARLGGG